MPGRENEGVDSSGKRQIRKRIAAMSEVPALPLSVQKIMSALTKETVTIHDLEEVIRHDQSLASKVVSVANSAFYHMQRGIAVNSLDQAILVLGLDAIRNIALGISIFKIFPLSCKTLKQMWAHAYRVALASGFLASRIDGSDREIAFLAGLLHDIGRVVFLTLADKRQLSRLPDARGKDIIPVEKEAFLCSHTEAGYWFLNGISLPDEVTLPVLHHHDFPEETEHPLIVAPVSIAEGLLSGLDNDEAADGEWSERTEALASKYGINKSVMDECRGLLNIEDEFIHAFFER
jgi:HD-like signal output (HDOD) protein